MRRILHRSLICTLIAFLVLAGGLADHVVHAGEGHGEAGHAAISQEVDAHVHHHWAHADPHQHADHCPAGHSHSDNPFHVHCCVQLAVTPAGCEASLGLPIAAAHFDQAIQPLLGRAPDPLPRPPRFTL